MAEAPDRVVVVNDRSEARGGASALALLSARLLSARGVPVTYVAGDGGCEGLEDIDEVVTVDAAALLERGRGAAFVSGLYNARAYRKLAGWIAENDTPGTVYHLHGWSKILSPAAMRALRPVAARTVLHAHDYFLVCPNGGFMNYPRNAPCGLAPMSAACVTTHCDKRSYPQKLWRVARQGVRAAVFDLARLPCDIVLIHPDMADHFVRSGVPRHRLHAVRNPVEPLPVPPAEAAANGSVFFLGRLEVEKGVADLAEAARLARVPLEIVGDGPIRAELEGRYPEATFHGWRPREEIGRLIGRARVLVMPTRYPEPFGLVAVEALGCGVPVIAADTALLAREIVEKGMGEAFRAGDVRDLADRLARLARDDARVKAMSAAARAGGSALANTAAGWCDGLMGRYAAALAASRRGASGRADSPPAGAPSRRASG